MRGMIFCGIYIGSPHLWNLPNLKGSQVFCCLKLLDLYTRGVKGFVV